MAFSMIATAQSTPGEARKKPVSKVKKCHIPSDSTVLLKVSLEEAMAWSDSVPLTVICDDMKTYKLHNFDFTIMTLKPFESKEFGTGNGGIPILAKRSIASMQPRDAIIIKNATYLDENRQELPLPIITFSIREPQ